MSEETVVHSHACTGARRRRSTMKTANRMTSSSAQVMPSAAIVVSLCVDGSAMSDRGSVSGAYANESKVPLTDEATMST